MTEILTESFCERCGTRYTFESSAPRTSRLARVRTLSKGVRNFVMSDESSFSEAMAEARGEEEIAATSHQLDAFHQTFNFCLTCRQYTCGDCWNEPEGRCLTCAPVPGQEDAEQVFAASLATVAFEPIAETNGHEEEVTGVEAWPEMDLPAERLARVMEPPPAVATVATAAIIDDAGGAVEAVEADGAADAAEALGASEGAGSEASPGVAGVAPGQSLEEAIAAYEAMLASEEQGSARAGGAVPLDPPSIPEAAADQAAPVVEPEAAAAAWVAAGALPGPEPVPADVEPPVAASPATAGLAAAGLAAAAAGAEAGRSSEPEPQAEPLAAEVEPEPVAAEVEPEPMAAEVEPEPMAAEASPVDRVEQPTWPVPPPTPATLDARPAPAPVQPPAPAPWLTVAPEDAPPPEWPAAPAWAGPANRRDVPTTLAGRPLLPQGDAAALWAASAKEVLGAAPAPFGAAPQPLAASEPAPQAQPCVNCGLSLSANARFCRRCGTRQG